MVFSEQSHHDLPLNHLDLLYKRVDFSLFVNFYLKPFQKVSIYWIYQLLSLYAFVMPEVDLFHDG